MTSILDTAVAWHEAGYHILPVKTDGTKGPALATWKQYQTRRPTAEELLSWCANAQGIGVLTGTPARIEMLEAEGRAVDAGQLDQLADLAEASGLADLWQTVANGYCEVTPGGGIHWYYRVDGHMRGNTKLARRPGPDGKPEVMWETRGEGGFSIIAPSAGTTHPTGRGWDVRHGTVAGIPTITADERDALHALCSMLDEMPVATEQERAQQAPRTQTGTGTRPGDDFNQRATWDEILTGWTKVKRMGDGWAWRRPGKNDPGISATTGQSGDGADRLYVFSTSTEFEPERPYTKFAAYALLSHGGSYAEAARALAAQGYGDQRATPPPPPFPETTPPAIEDTLFDATPQLGHIRTAARARMVSPHAVLGAVLARALAETPPCWTLPPLIGSHASLNLAIALQGPPGTGKSAANETAGDLLPGRTAKQISASTGEGLIQEFLQWDKETKKNVLTDRPNRLLYIDELGQLSGIQNRSGATIGPILRTMLTGSAVGTTTADTTRNRQLPGRSYRLAAVAGVQPALAGTLLDDADAGTPQRWLWMPACDPHLPEQAPEWPGPLKWSLPAPPQADLSGYRVIALPDHVRELVLAEHRKRQRGEGDALDGHALLTRLKVAAGLTLLHGQSAVDDQMWQLSGLVMAVSDISRETCARAVADRRAEEQKARGRNDAIREIAAREAHAEGATKLAKLVWRTVDRGCNGDKPHANQSHKREEGCTRRCLTFSLRNHKGADPDAAIATAVDLCWIDQRGGRYYPGDSRPEEGAGR